MVSDINLPPPNAEEDLERYDGNVTAKPKDMAEIADVIVNDDLATETLDFGEMNLEDAKASGYTDENGNAISKAVHDVEGSPTGAFTDIGAGRSSVVKHH